MDSKRAKFSTKFHLLFPIFSFHNVYYACNDGHYAMCAIYNPSGESWKPLCRSTACTQGGSSWWLYSPLPRWWRPSWSTPSRPSLPTWQKYTESRLWWSTWRDCFSCSCTPSSPSPPPTSSTPMAHAWESLSAVRSAWSESPCACSSTKDFGSPLRDKSSRVSVAPSSLTARQRFHRTGSQRRPEEE